MNTEEIIKNAKLTAQTYGVNMAQCRYGRPKGIWLECTTCPTNEVIVGSKPSDSIWATSISDEEAAQVFINHGWTGEGPVLKKQKCPVCSKKVADEREK